MKKHFPIFKNSSLVYLDSAATTQLPTAVIEAINKYLRQEHANTHRGLYELSIKNTDRYETGRQLIKEYLSASNYEVIYTTGTTHSLNLIANGLKNKLKKGDVIVLSRDNHHSNIVPWQELAKKTGVKITYIPITNDGRFDINKLKPILKQAVVLSISHVSNVTGVIHEVEQVTKLARANNCLTIIDGAQAVAHTEVSLKKINCDAYVFSAHKMYGPTGAGAIVAKKTLLENLTPIFFGGSMINKVEEQETSYAGLPHRLEAGTPPLLAIIGLLEAVKWLKTKDLNSVWQQEKLLTEFALKELAAIEGVNIIGPTNSKQRIGLISFNVKGLHAHDLAELLAGQQIAVRAGHHCAQLIHRFNNTSSSLRVSFGIYTEKKDVEQFIKALKQAIKTMHHE